MTEQLAIQELLMQPKSSHQLSLPRSTLHQRNEAAGQKRDLRVSVNMTREDAGCRMEEPR